MILHTSFILGIWYQANSTHHPHLIVHNLHIKEYMLRRNGRIQSDPLLVIFTANR